MSAQLALPSATFAWANVPNMTACAPATISWTYTGPPQTVAIGTNPASNLSLLVDATLQNYTIPLVRLRPGEYTMTVTVGGEQSSDEEMLRRRRRFTSGPAIATGRSGLLKRLAPGERRLLTSVAVDAEVAQS